MPEPRQLAEDNRNQLRRTVRYLVGEAGIDQIVDFGSGLPTVGNVHEVAHQIDPSVRVASVDIDPVVLAHGRALLADDHTTAVITADVRDPDAVFDDPTVRDLIDYSRPFAVLASGILHHFGDHEDPWSIADRIRARLGTGSYPMISNFLEARRRPDPDGEPATHAVCGGRGPEGLTSQPVGRRRSTPTRCEDAPRAARWGG